MAGTYPNQVKDLCDYLYHDRGGYFVLMVANLDLFGYPTVGAGYRAVRPLTYDEALTIKLEHWQALFSVYPDANKLST